mmetsp:Transcript_54892/g.161376  ORF Transcript_54892/g.161376 Transcript_54892/m.161376 type:complete len:1469 (-) Transcript_54892:120-4526(-)
MPVRAASTGPSTVGGNRVRSASPARRALAIDMRRIANLLRDPPGAGGDTSMTTSMCSSPHSAWEPGDGRHAATPSSRNQAQAVNRMVMQNQVSAMAERVNAAVGSLQQQSSEDRRRLAALERKLDSKLDALSREGEGREKFAELQGSVNGLIEETQALTRRVEGLDERLWARTSGSEFSKQRARELEQQVQTMEQQHRLTLAAVEETQKRQATKLRRSEHAVEEAVRRLSKVEAESGASSRHGHGGGYMEARVGTLEQQLEQLDTEMRTLQMQLDEGMLQGAGNIEGTQDMGDDAMGPRLDEALRSAEQSVYTLDKRVTSQVEEVAASLASLRVKVDGQLSRVGTLAERLEVAHAPALEALRAEMSQARLQDRREVDSTLASLKGQVQEALECDETVSEVKEALRQTRAEVAALSLRPEDNPTLRAFDERLCMMEQDMGDVRARLDGTMTLAPMGDEDGLGGEGGEAFNATVGVELEDIRKRLEWVEEQGAAGAAHERSVDPRQSNQTQSTLCELVENVSRLKQQTASSESAHNSIAQQVQHLQLSLERRGNEDSLSMRSSTEVEAKVGAISQQVADIAARLLEVEGGLDFAREESALAPPLGEMSNVSAVSEAGSAAGGRGSLPPLPPGGAAAMQQKLEAVAEHLEVVDELAERVAELERRASEGFGVASQSPMGSPVGQITSEVSFGGEAPMRGAAAAGATSSQIDGIQQQLSEFERDISSLRESVSNQELAGEQLKMSTKSDLQGVEKLTERVASLEGQVKEAGAKPATPRVPEMSPRASDAELDELRDDIRKLKDAMTQHSKQVMEMLQEKLEDDSGERALEGLDELQSKFQKLSAKLSDAGDVLESLQEESPKQHAALAEVRALLKDVGSPASSPKAGGALPEEISAKLKALEERPALTAEAVGEQVQAEVKRQVADLAQKVEGLAPKELTTKLEEALRKELEDVAKELRQTKESVQEQVEGAQKRLEEVAAKAAAPAEASKELSGLEERVKAVETRGQELATLGEEAETAMEGIEKKLQKMSSEKLENDNDKAETQKSLGEIRKQLEELKTKAAAAESGAGEREQKLKTDLEEIRDQLKKLGEQTPAAAPAPAGDGGDQLEQRLKSVEEKLASGGVPRTPRASPEDAAERSQVQEQLEELTKSISQELKGLVSHQDELSGTRTALDDLTKRVEALASKPGSPAAGAGVGELSTRVDEALKRLKGCEDAGGTLRKDLDSLQGPRKVGIGMSAKAEDESTLADLTGRLDLLFEQVAELQASLAALRSSSAEMDKIRAEEKALFGKSSEELELGIEGVKKALQVLTEYYAKDDKAHSSADGAGEGIIGLLEVCESDFSKDLAEITAVEQTAQAEHETMTKESELELTMKTQDVTYKTKESKSLDKSVGETSSDRSTVQAELDAILDYWSKIQDECVAKAEPYAEIKARREAEISGLKEALTILESEVALVQKSARRTLRGVARHQ